MLERPSYDLKKLNFLNSLHTGFLRNRLPTPCYEKLEKKPDVLIIDGSGIAHPRGIGIATHIGILLDKPSIGVTKSRLVGEFDERKKCSELIYKGKKVGCALKRNGKYIFISPGHKVSLKTSLKIVKKCLLDKLPEPIRLAHEYVNEVKKNVLGKRCFSR